MGKPKETKQLTWAGSMPGPRKGPIMLIEHDGKWYHVLKTQFDAAPLIGTMTSLIGMGLAEEVEEDESDDELEYYEAIERLEDANIPIVLCPETGRPMILVSIVEHTIGMLDELLSAGEDGTTPLCVCPDLDGLEFWSDTTQHDVYQRGIGEAVYSYVEERFKG